MSVMDDILVAVKSVIDGLSTGVPCYIKKMDFVGKAEVPSIIVAPDSPRKIRGQQFNNNIWYDYSVKIIVTKTGNMKINTNIDDLEPLSDAIVSALFGASLSGVAVVWDTDVEFGNTFNLREAQNNYDTSDMVITFSTSENRQ